MLYFIKYIWLTESSQVKIFVSCYSADPCLPSSMLVMPEDHRVLINIIIKYNIQKLIILIFKSIVYRKKGNCPREHNSVGRNITFYMHEKIKKYCCPVFYLVTPRYIDAPLEKPLLFL